MTHIDFHELYQAGDEKHERENDQSEEGVAGYLADDITIENAHDAEVQCTTLSVSPGFSLLHSGNERGLTRSVADRGMSSRPNCSCLYTLILSMPTAMNPTNRLRQPCFRTPAE